MMFPIALLNVVNPFKSKIVSFDRNEYYYNNVDKLSFIKCPNCRDQGGVFKGFFYIGCNRCLNLFLTESEMVSYLNTGEND